MCLLGWDRSGRPRFFPHQLRAYNLVSRFPTYPAPRFRPPFDPSYRLNSSWALVRARGGGSTSYDDEYEEDNEYGDDWGEEGGGEGDYDDDDEWSNQGWRSLRTNEGKDVILTRKFEVDDGGVDESSEMEELQAIVDEGNERIRETLNVTLELEDLVKVLKEDIGSCGNVYVDGIEPVRSRFDSVSELLEKIRLELSGAGESSHE